MTCLSFAARAFNMPTRHSNLLLRLSFKTAHIDAGAKSNCSSLYSFCHYALYLHQPRSTRVAWTEAYEISWSCLSAIGAYNSPMRLLASREALRSASTTL